MFGDCACALYAGGLCSQGRRASLLLLLFVVVIEKLAVYRHVPGFELENLAARTLTLTLTQTHLVCTIN